MEDLHFFLTADQTCSFTRSTLAYVQILAFILVITRPSTITNQLALGMVVETKTGLEVVGFQRILVAHFAFLVCDCRGTSSRYR